MDTDEQKTEQQGINQDLPGSDFDIEDAGSQAIDEEELELAVRGWKALLTKVLEEFSSTKEILFPSRFQ